MIDDVDQLGWLLAQRSRIASLEADIQGMVALNQYRLSRDEIIAYDDEAFQAVAKELLGIHTMIMKNR